MHTGNVIWTEKFVFMIYTYTNAFIYMYIYKQLKRGHEFEREQGGIHGRGWSLKGIEKMR